VISKRNARLRQFRRENDLTVPDFARRVGMSETALRAVVNEDRKRGFAGATRDRLLEALRVSLRKWYEP